MVRIEYTDCIGVLQEGREPWLNGESVVVVGPYTGERSYPDWERDYFDFVVATRMNDDEPILLLIELFERRKAEKRPYSTLLHKLVSRYAEKSGLPKNSIKRRFRNLRTQAVGAGSKWV